jgi:hypothetical protein
MSGLFVAVCDAAREQPARQPAAKAKAAARKVIGLTVFMQDNSTDAITYKTTGNGAWVVYQSETRTLEPERSPKAEIRIGCLLDSERGASGATGPQLT